MANHSIIVEKANSKEGKNYRYAEEIYFNIPKQWVPGETIGGKIFFAADDQAGRKIKEQSGNKGMEVVSNKRNNGS
jgi:hypothetical protein